MMNFMHTSAEVAITLAELGSSMTNVERSSSEKEAKSDPSVTARQLMVIQASRTTCERRSLSELISGCSRVLRRGRNAWWSKDSHCTTARSSLRLASRTFQSVLVLLRVERTDDTIFSTSL